MAAPSPSDLIESARAYPVPSLTRTNLLLEAVAVALASNATPRARASSPKRKPEVAPTPDE